MEIRVWGVFLLMLYMLNFAPYLEKMRLRIAVAISFLFSSLQVLAQNTSKSTEIPAEWHHLDQTETGYFGVSTKQAYSYLDSIQAKPRKVVVAVIDADLDIAHEDLKDKIWNNPNPSTEGYVNDINGWNFLGSADGQQVTKVGTESFREYKRLRSKFEGKTIDDFKKKKDRELFTYFEAVKKDAKIGSYLRFAEMAKLTWDAFRVADSLVSVNQLPANATLADVTKIEVKDSVAKEYYDAAMRSLWKYNESASWKEVLADQENEYNLVLNRIKSLDDPSSPRDIIGDDLSSLKDKYYGNSNLYDSTSYHGTFVSGIIGAARGNGIGINGIADQVEIMGIRAVPDGDEYDKDVALAVRYAVDNGADIINMSFGKYFSPESKWVQKAMNYAMKKDVLIVHAAGNNKKNIDSVVMYPTLPNNYKKRNSFIRVGATDASGDIASFSNYGPTQVDLFAPGMTIYSTNINNTYSKANGTSFSAPVVAGVAALVWSYFPDYSAKELKEILLKSVVTDPGQKLKEKSISGGIINANKAVRIANEG